MPTIQVLDSHVADLIAAGEVLCHPFLLYQIVPQPSSVLLALFVFGCLLHSAHSPHPCFASGETDRNLRRHPFRCLLTL